MFSRIILVALCGVVFCSLLITQCSASFQKCPSPHGQIQAIRVSGCTDKMAYCVLQRGTNASIEIDFMPYYNASSVKVKITGEIAGVPIPFNVTPDEACEDYGLICPLALNETSKFDMTMPILKEYPPIRLNINIKLVDDTDTLMACLKFPAKITFKTFMK